MKKVLVLLVVDVQKGITDGRLYEFEKVEDNIKHLVEAARVHGKEVIFVQHDDGPGSVFSRGDEAYEIYDEFQPLANERIFEKRVNSAFHSSTGLLGYLQEKGKKQIMVVGLQTDYCMDAAYHYFNDFIWPNRYAKCISMEEALERLKDKKATGTGQD